ncbi:cysteine proteinase inhibitor A-like [Vigna umbellata]|uniref:cysteine proteinase inhibitor A-like n=1 Tax=Vigna umbellata TaxID=87088 RepID=UPI001F5F8363|nr:cysteine proteinase inhibitor A-like [Vigna umbellata]
MATAKVTAGGITDVPGAANSVEIEELARFAVDDYNKKQNALLELVTVISAKQQIVSGVLYYITLEVKDGESKNVYETKVWVREWLNSKEVLEFNLVDDSTREVTGGGVSDVPPDTPHIESLARFAVDQYKKNQVLFYYVLLPFLHFTRNHYSMIDFGL